MQLWRSMRCVQLILPSSLEGRPTGLIRWEVNEESLCVGKTGMVFNLV